MEKPKAYIVLSSKKDGNWKIDADEVAKVVQGIATGAQIKVRSGLINPSYYVGIVEDVERISEYMAEINRVIADNSQHDKLGIGQKRQLPEFKKVSDIFEGVDLRLPNPQRVLNN